MLNIKIEKAQILKEKPKKGSHLALDIFLPTICS